MRISEGVLDGDVELCSDDGHHLGTIRGVCSIIAFETDVQKVFGKHGLIKLFDKDDSLIACLWVGLDCWRKYK